MPLACAYPIAAGVPDSGTGMTRSASAGILGRQPPAQLDPGRVHAPAGDRGVRPGQVDVLEQAAARLGHGEPPGPDAPLVDRDQLARLDLAHEGGPDDVECRRLARHHPAAGQPPEHQRAEALRIASRVQGPLVHEDQRVGAPDQRQRGQRRLAPRPGLRPRPPDSGGAANRAVSTSVSDVAPPARPAAWAPSRAASSRVLIRFPLWPRARLADCVARNVGWAFSQTDDPLVEYRQWPTAIWPRMVFSTDSSKTWATSPMSLYTTIRLPSLTAIPAIPGHGAAARRGRNRPAWRRPRQGTMRRRHRTRPWAAGQRDPDHPSGGHQA